MTVLIEEMSIQDYDEVRALWLAVEGIAVSEVDSKNIIARLLAHNPGLSFVARVDGQLAGAVLCSHDGRRGYIDQLAVGHAYRRQGIGRALVSRCLFNLMRSGIRKWHLFVLEDNQDAIAFWKKLGWTERVELVTMSQHGPNAA
ncbi:MAG: GNAT family N-acetyltransferase [Chloroflexota bacterium]|nr:GNAT family N-acetyltransferase [Anaerolineales bacterium]MCB8965878.1 GNAT family N-acetyltransferase [Ardenticatenaceae bacterium]